MATKKRSTKKHQARHGLAAHAKRPKLKPHHTKPYRKRHLFLLFAALVYTMLLMFQIGVLVGSSRQTVLDITPHASQRSTEQTVSSAYGFEFTYDTSLFKASATAIDDKGTGSTLPGSQLADEKQINFVSLSPQEGALAPTLAATQLSTRLSLDKQALAQLARDPVHAQKTPAERAAHLLPLNSSPEFDVTVVSQGSEAIGDGTLVQRTTYQYTPRFDGGTTYAVAWHGVVEGRAFVIRLAGLVSSSAVPSEYQTVLDSFVFRDGPKVQGLSFDMSRTAHAETSNLDGKYLADLVSPAVVKIYHVVCGDLVVGDTSLGYDCRGMTGSGFLVSHDGYIATNGHVVVLTAKDLLVQIVTSSPEVLLGFLRGAGLTDQQIATIARDPQQLAAIVAKIYDLSDDDVLLDRQRQATIVSLGNKPLTLAEDQDIESLLEYQDNDDIKQAKVVGHNYNGKDLWIAQSGDPAGFSSSDVALLKVQVENAPTITINQDQITQNEKVVVLGFPGDAENALVDRNTLEVSVTNGSVSAIRDAAGGNGKLYQSDADASQGNSGGPAVTEKGEVFGLTTYRFASDDQGNAAKTYMRDITDLTDLAKEKDAIIDSTSTTQQAWVKGLTLFSNNHFSAAKKEFAKVSAAYSPHRLVGSYVENADKQIAAGNDVPLYSPILIGGAVVGGIALLASAAVLIVRHRAHHQAYVSQRTPNAPASPAGGTPPNVPTMTQPSQAGGSVPPPPPTTTPMPVAPTPPAVTPPTPMQPQAAAVPAATPVQSQAPAPRPIDQIVAPPPPQQPVPMPPPPPVATPVSPQSPVVIQPGSTITPQQ